MKSIRWIHKILMDGQPATIEIMIGVNSIADRCYVRINQDAEYWFSPIGGNRQDTIQQGLDILKKQHQSREVKSLDGSPYNWTIQ